MDSRPTEEDLAAWNEYLQGVHQDHEAEANLFKICYWPNRQTVLVEILRLAFGQFDDRFYILEVVEKMEPEHQQLLIVEMLPLATMNETKRSTNPAQDIILSWPRAWLDENLEKHARAVMEGLRNGAFSFTHLSEFYSGLIYLFRNVNMATAKRIANEAATHVDADVRWIGKDWLNQPDWSETAV